MPLSTELDRRVSETETTKSRPTSNKAVAVTDDGRGFDMTDVPNSFSLGIAKMRERTNLVNGTLVIQSKPYQGTHIKLNVPLTEPPAREIE